MILRSTIIGRIAVLPQQITCNQLPWVPHFCLLQHTDPLAQGVISALITDCLHDSRPELGSLLALVVVLDAHP